MIPDRCAACRRKCSQFLAYLESVVLAEEPGPLADPRFLARTPMEDATPPPGAWQNPWEPRLRAA
jgi:hypothetical protein